MSECGSAESSSELDDGREPSWAARSWSSLRTGAVGVASLDWLLQVIERYPRPETPPHEAWEISLTGLAAELPYVPDFATRPLGLFDGLGAVSVSPTEVGFDGDEIPWERVVEVHTQASWAALPVGDLGGAVVRKSLRIPQFLPGARWASRTVADLTCSVFLAAFPLRPLELAADPTAGTGALAEPDAAATDDDGLSTEALLRMRQPVVSKIVFRGRLGGTKELVVGPMAVLLQALIPASVDTITWLAAARGVQVIHTDGMPGDLGTAYGRGAAWRSRFGSLADGLALLRSPSEGSDDTAVSGPITMHEPWR